MIIFSKEKIKGINLDNVNEIFKGGDGFTIKVSFRNGGGTQLERYNSTRETDIAMEMLCEAIGQQDKYVMPTEEQIQARIVATRDRGEFNKQHNGGKRKGHGGS